MKRTLPNKLLILIILFQSILSVNTVYTQNVNTGIYFQAVARDNFSNPAKDRKIYVQSSIIRTTANGIKVLSEEYQTSTDATGVFSISLGQGTRLGGTASSLTGIDWSKGPYYLNLKVAITPIAPVTNWDYTKDWIDLGTTSFGAVPYALYSASAAGLDQKLSVVDTSKMLSIYAKALSVDAIAKVVGEKISTSDTSAMLAPYANIVNSIVASNLTSLTANSINTALNSKVNVADSGSIYSTPFQLKGVKFDTANLSIRIDAKENTSNKSIAVDLGGTSPSDILFPTQKAVKDYVTANNASRGILDGSIITIKIADDAVTDAKINTVSGSKVIGSITGNAATASLARNITATANTTLTSLSNLNTVGTITSGVWSGTEVAVEKGGTGATTASAARTNLGLAVGSDVLAYRTFGTAANNNTADFEVPLTFTSPLSRVTNTISIPAATTSVNGYLSSTDWNTFNAKQTALTAGSGISISAGTISATGLTTSNLSSTAGITNAQLAGSIAASKLVGTDITTVGTLANLTVTNAIAGSITGNAATATTATTATSAGTASTATKLATPKNINGVAFDGSLDIIVTADAGTLTGTTLKSTITGSSLTTVGTIGSGIWNGTKIDIANGGTGLNTAGSNGQILTSTNAGTLTWTTLPSAGVPYSGASGAIDLGSYDLTVNGLTVGRGAGGISSNTANGNAALFSNTTGSGNTANGNAALRSNTTGTGNTANGNAALFSNTTGSGNTANGNAALRSNTTGTGNTANGNAALQFNTTGSNNTANGKDALLFNTTGTSNTVNGAQALLSNTTGSYNTANGFAALLSNTTGSNNTANGFAALQNNTTGYDNTANGISALQNNTTGNNNTANGRSALLSNTTGTFNTANGFRSLLNNSTGGSNTASGYSAGTTNTTGNENTLIGYSADVSSNNLSNATALGNGALVAASNTIQLGNTSVTNVKTSGTITAGSVTYPSAHGTANQVLSTTGSGTLTWTAPSSGVPYTGATRAVDLGSYDLTINGLTVGRGRSGIASNTAIGNSALISNTTGNDNTATGFYSLYFNTTGRENIAYGLYSLMSNTTGSGNTANGANSMKNNTTGGGNTANGAYSLRENTTGNNNTANGTLSLNDNSSGSNNTAYGLYSMRSNTWGNNNTALGANAGAQNINGNQLTLIGYSADVSFNNLSNATALGNGALVAASNTIQLGNTSVTNVKTSGTITAGSVTYPSAHGTANQVLSTTGSGTLTWTTPSTGGGGGSGTYTKGLNASLGGYVFFVTPDGKHGLVAAGQDQGDGSWYAGNQDKISNPSNHDVNGKNFTDWRMPSRYELNLMFLERTNIGLRDGLASYWSSTEYDNAGLYTQGVTYNVMTVNKANPGYYFRAIRSF